MKIRIHTALVFETLMLVVVGAMLAVATRYPYGVKVVPFVVGVPTLIFLFVLWLGSVFPEWKRLGRKGPPESQDAEEAFEDSDFTLWRPVLNTLGWITAYYVLIFILGFFVATPVWLTAFFFQKSNLSLLKSVLGAVVCSFAIIRMVHAFGIELWPGAIPRIITRILGAELCLPYEKMDLSPSVLSAVGVQLLVRAASLSAWHFLKRWLLFLPLSHSSVPRI